MGTLFDSIRKECTDADGAQVALLARIATAQTTIRDHMFGFIPLMAAALLAPAPWAGVATILAVLCFMVILWNLLDRTMYAGLLHLAELHDVMRPEATGADWLAYHLAERVREEQAALAAHEAVQAAEAAIAAIDAWGITEPAARDASEPVH